ncbi:MAG: hypothetical protein ACKVI6_05235 [Candidatus Poseidoniales archaeon]|jgi:SepF-like predicted cell division protein (DUF552 family)|tara:strand:+ start:1305 stop:1697 length:393 start_codon:yes stop_codon:yes gene_type:complete
MSSEGREPRWIEMEETSLTKELNIEPGEKYHDLGDKYPNSPIPRGPGDTIIHRAVLEDLTGVPPILNWISDGDLVIIEMSQLMKRETELSIAVSKIRDFVELDLSGTVLLLGKTRLLLLPPDFDGIEQLN